MNQIIIVEIKEIKPSKLYGIFKPLIKILFSLFLILVPYFYLKSLFMWGNNEETNNKIKWWFI